MKLLNFENQKVHVLKEDVYNSLYLSQNMLLTGCSRNEMSRDKLPALWDISNTRTPLVTFPQEGENHVACMNEKVMVSGSSACFKLWDIMYVSLLKWLQCQAVCYHLQARIVFLTRQIYPIKNFHS